MPEVSVNVEVYCTCGEGLCNQTESTLTRSRREPCFIVSPCTRCLQNAEDAGYKVGYEVGVDETQVEE